MDTLPGIDALAALVMEAAKDELLPRFNRIGHQRLKPDGSLVTEADLAVDRRLRSELARRWPRTPFLSEEMEPSEQYALLSGREDMLWCLDPLDGTSNYAAGIPFFAVSLSLIDAHGVRLAVTCDPLRDETFSAVRAGGAFLNGRLLQARRLGLPLSRCVALVDFKRLNGVLRSRLAHDPPYASQRNLGACALEWAWLAAGRGHLYLHGGQKLWDLAGGTLLLTEAGGRSSTLEGEPVYTPRTGARSALATLDPALFEPWHDWLADSEARAHN